MIESPAGLGVSRETFERLRIFADLLTKWNPHINLVSRATVDDLWRRHFKDSAQLLRLCDHSTDHWVDLGSGGGFPGLVIAAMQDEPAGPDRVTLIESDTRKATFIRTVIREAGLGAEVIAKRIEDAPEQNADIISARALAPLEALLGLAFRHFGTDAICLFPKGEKWRDELNAAHARWSFDYEAIKSETDDNAVILKIGGLVRV